MSRSSDSETEDPSYDGHDGPPAKKKARKAAVALALPPVIPPVSLPPVALWNVKTTGIKQTIDFKGSHVCVSKAATRDFSALVSVHGAILEKWRELSRGDRKYFIVQNGAEVAKGITWLKDCFLTEAISHGYKLIPQDDVAKFLKDGSEVRIINFTTDVPPPSRVTKDMFLVLYGAPLECALGCHR